MAAGDHKKIEDLTFNHSRYVLALPGWYPTWLDILPGDFNQRHINAASLYIPQIVLYIGKDQTGTLTKTEVRVHQTSEAIIEILVVYAQSKIKWWDAIRSNILFLFLLMKYSSIIRHKFGKPVLLHSYIVMRGGLAGWLLSMRWKLPFILTENWTIYYPSDPGFLLKRNFIFRWLVNRILKSVDHFLPVTNDLRLRVKQMIANVPSTVVPNVVETRLFNFKGMSSVNHPFIFVHVSTMVYQKNPEGLLRAFAAFNKRNPATFLRLVGPYQKEIYDYAATLGLNNKHLEFTGAVSYQQVAQLLKQSEALVLFSRYENLPCVILEAFCCGLPVIATNVGGIREVINEINGILVESENEAQLLDAFTHIFTNYTSYKKEDIATSSYNLFSYQAVGNQINNVYNQLLK